MPCRYCTKEVSVDANVCPHCGQPDPYVDWDYFTPASSSSFPQPYRKAHWYDNPTLRLTLGGGYAAGIGWFMVTSATTFSFVWWLGVILLVGGGFCLIPAALTAGIIALIIVIVLFALAVIVSLVNYFMHHPY